MEPPQKKAKCAGANSVENESSQDESDHRNEVEENKKRSDLVQVEQKDPEVFKENPLLVLLILENILQCLQPNLDELKQFRLVCKLWYKVTLERWRRMAVIKIILNPMHLRNVPWNGMPYDDVYLNEFEIQNSFYELKEKPYKRYKFMDTTMDIEVYDEEGDAKLFWEVIGPHAEYVHFEKCTFTDSLRRARPFAQLLVRKLPNVKHLALTDVKNCEKRSSLGITSKRFKKIKEPEQKKYNTFQTLHPNLNTLTAQGAIGIDLKDLFSLTPKLTSIIGVDGHPAKIKYFDLLNKVEQTIVGRSRDEHIQLNDELTPLSNLKHLNLMETSTFLQCPTHHVIAQKLIEANLRLETFAATVKDDWSPALAPVGIHLNQPNTSIELFLGTLSSSLQVLKLFRIPLISPFINFLAYTKMSALRELHLWGNVTFSFHFLKNTPNLQVLHINLECFEKEDQIEYIICSHKDIYSDISLRNHNFSSAVPMSKTFLLGTVLPKLQTLHVDHAFPVDSLKSLAEWMPNLKCLKTILTESTVSMACEHWPELTELVCLHGSKIENYNVERNDSDKPGSSSTTANATIGDLKELERFQLDALCGESKLSDACVVNGFLKMTALKSVQICVSEMMSTKAEEMLKQRFGFNCRVIRNYTGGDHSNYDCCERTQFHFDLKRGFSQPQSHQGIDRRSVSGTHSNWIFSEHME